MMRRALGALFLLLVELTARVVGDEIEEDLHFFSRVLGTERVIETFGSPAVLHQCVDVTSREDDPRGNLEFGCAGYEVGSKFAQDWRSKETTNTTVLPILVDFAADRMCFLLVTPADKEQEVEIETTLTVKPFIGALKVHDATYNIIEGGESSEEVDLTEIDLRISYRPEAFEYKVLGTGLTDYSMVQRHFDMLTEKISTYTPRFYHRFFWSSPATGKFFDSLDGDGEGVQHDRQRYKNWSTLRSQYEALTNKDTSYSYGHYADPDADACSYEALFRGMQVTESTLVLPLAPLQNVHDDLRRVCMANILAAFADHPAVHFLTIDPRPTLLNYRARSIPQSAKVGSDLSVMPYTAAGLLGNGQVVAIADTGVDVYSCYFFDPQGRVTPSDISSPKSDSRYRKVVQYNYNGCGDTSDGEGGHGTHVSGIAVGSISGKDIATDGKYDGVAPNAKLSFADLGKPGSGLCIPSPNQLFGAGRSAGARVFSNSWGTYFTGSGYYYGQDYDAYLLANMDSALLFSAGNVGKVSSVTREASAKNTIAIGSSETTLGSSNISYVAFYSSRGPTYDNRIKPDLVSPGDQLNSAKASGSTSQTCNTIQMTGTSMACPSAAGNALLIRQYFMDGHFWAASCNKAYRSCRSFAPTGVLLKTILAHSGTSMTLFHGGGQYDVPLGQSPDMLQGFGRLSIGTTLPLKTDPNDLFVADAVNIMENSNVRYTVKVASSSFPLTVTIGWYDPPNVQGTTSKALLNDLDLTLRSPSGQTYYPNNRPSVDVVNTLERVRVQSPATGTWTVDIRCKSLPFAGNQLFAVVITSKGQVSYA